MKKEIDPTKDASTARVMLLGLTFECPLGGNPGDCMICEKRNLSMKGRLQWVKSLSDDECIEYYRAHLECMAAKQKGACGISNSIIKDI